MAETEPPGRPHSSTGSPYEPQHTLRASADPDYSGAFTVTGRAGFGCDPLDRSFGPRGDLDIVWASLR